MGKGDIESLFDMINMILPLFIVAVVLWVIYDKSLLTGEWNIITNTYIEVVPYIIGFALGVYYLIKRGR